MLLTTEVEIKLNGYYSLKHLEEKGYTIPYFKNKDYHIRVVPESYLMVKVEDLPPKSSIKIKVLCDYCKIEIIEKRYSDYNRDNINAVIKTDCCKKCSPIKQEEVSMLKYGVSHPMKLQETKDRQTAVMIEKYGVSHIMDLQSTKDKIKATNIAKYGCENPMQNEDVKARAQQTNLERYGFITPLCNNEIIAKTKASNQLNYGCDNVFANKDIQEQIRQSLYNNDTAPCSCQQRYLHCLLGGELNYPIFNYSVDIAFVEDKIYLEYDGNGHTMQVDMGNITEDEQIEIERKRYYFLKNRGWSGIRFISAKNRFPSDEIVIDLINKAKEYVKSGHSWFEINIDNNELRCSDYTKSFDFGKLTWIKKQHLEKFNTNN